MAIFDTTTALKKNKERFENEMAELGSSRDMSGRESEAAGRISGLGRKIEYVTTDRVCRFPLQRDEKASFCEQQLQ